MEVREVESSASVPGGAAVSVEMIEDETAVSVLEVVVAVEVCEDETLESVSGVAVEVGEAMETETEEAVAVQGGVVAVGVVTVEEEEGKVEVEVACQHRPHDQGNAGHSSSDKEIPEAVFPIVV